MIKFLLLALFIQPVAELPVPDEDQLLQRGLQLEENEQYQQALKVWGSALTELDTSNFEIARAYIRLAAEQKLKSYYEKASSLYRWGLSAKQIAPNKKALSKELLLLEPLVHDSNFGRWQRMFEQEDPQLYKQILLFWENRDPTPVTNYNERLLEHWERIAYAKNHFTKDEEPPYGTDDRGKYWVRYGEPDRHYEGRLKTTSGQVEMTCRELSACDPLKMAQVVSQLHRRPAYEIWIYERPNTSMEYNIVLIFGDDPASGFSRVQLIEDFIPNRAFTFSDRYSFPSLATESSGSLGLMSPGMVMQWLYYKQLATLDPYFSNRYEDMHFNWDRGNRPAGTFGKFSGHVQEQQTQMATIQNMERAPEETSTYAKEFPEIPLDVYQYRMLNKQNEPIFVTFLESSPQKIFIEDLAANQDSMRTAETTTVSQMFSYYELVHGLQLKSPDGTVISQHRMPTKLVLDSTNTARSSSVFTVPYVSGEVAQLLYAELYNHHPKSQPKIETSFPNDRRGIGKFMLKQPEPLPSFRGDLQMGDLILGYGMRENAQNSLFPFVVANNRKILRDKNLSVHFEVYHLRRDQNGIARFQLAYEILPINWVGQVKEKEQEVSLTLNFETKQSRYTQDLEIQTRDLPPGEYVLRMRATEPESDQEVEREIRFEVVEEPALSSAR